MNTSQIPEDADRQVIPEEAVKSAKSIAWGRYGSRPDAAYLRAILEAAAPHMLASALAGHVNRGPLEGFVGERCECGRWSDSDVDYIAHIKQEWSK